MHVEAKGAEGGREPAKGARGKDVGVAVEEPEGAGRKFRVDRRGDREGGDGGKDGCEGEVELDVAGTDAHAEASHTGETGERWEATSEGEGQRHPPPPPDRREPSHAWGHWGSKYVRAIPQRRPEVGEHRGQHGLVVHREQIHRNRGGGNGRVRVALGVVEGEGEGGKSGEGGGGEEDLLGVVGEGHVGEVKMAELWEDGRAGVGAGGGGSWSFAHGRVPRREGVER